MGGILDIKNVFYTYETDEENKNKAYALKGISFSVREGEFVALVGHNGSGKSTLAKLMNGLYLPTSGDVTVKGMNTKDAGSLFEIRKSVGMVFQNPDNQMVASIVEDDVAFGPENLGVEREEIEKRVTESLESVGMTEYRMRTPHKLSGGQKQRIAIAGVLALRPRVLVLDESTAMLDPVGRREVLKVVMDLRQKENMTVILITHFMDEAIKADKVIVMNDGKAVMSGTPGEVFERADELTSYGLDLPHAAYIAAKLRADGMKISREALTAEELSEEVCRSLRKG